MLRFLAPLYTYLLIVITNPLRPLPNEPLVLQERGLTAVDFGLFAACGAVGCTTTHMTVIPLDVVKTRLQTNPGRYAGLAEGVTTIAKEVGAAAATDAAAAAAAVASAAAGKTR